MTKMEGNRCFGRLKAHELTEDEIDLVAGGDWGGDEYHSGYCANTVSEGNDHQEPNHIGCVYT